MVIKTRWLKMGPECPDEENTGTKASENPQEEGKEETGNTWLGTVNGTAKPVKVGPEPLKDEWDSFEHERSLRICVWLIA